MKYFFTFSLLMFSSFCLFAQQLEGRVLDSNNQEALSYVNIGLIGKDIGTVSDQNGVFSLKIPAQHLQDTLCFSMIGYKPKYLYPQDLMKDKEDLQIKLDPVNYELNEVVVIPKDYVPTFLGNKANKKTINAGFGENKLGYEMGVLMKLKKKQKGYLKKVILNVASCEYDSVFYRLNVYKMDGRMPGKNLLKKPIYISYSKEEFLQNIEIDLVAEEIFVQGKFLVTFELVKDLGEGGLNFCAGFFKSPLFYRETSQGKWQKIAPLAVGISSIVMVEVK